jgi:hypothetical protein
MVCVDKVHLQNCMACTRLIFNPNCEEARVLRNRYLTQQFCFNSFCLITDFCFTMLMFFVYLLRFADSGDSPSPLTLTQICAEPRVSTLEEFLYNTPRTTIQGLKDATTVSLSIS